jgi:hypothetical protein
MGWTISGLISGGLIVSGSTALFLAVWMIARLRKYRSANSITMKEEGTAGMVTLLTEPEFLDGLLRESDFEFLAAQPGYRREIGSKLRRHRKRIFRLGLGELAQEFHRIHAQARDAVANSGEQYASQYAPLVGLLIRQELTFWRAMARIELSLVLPGFAVRRFADWRHAALAGLVSSINTMRIETGSHATVL